MQTIATYPQFVVSEFEHRQVRQRIQILDLRYLIGTQEEPLHFHQGIEVFNFRQPIEAQVQDSVGRKRTEKTT